MMGLVAALSGSGAVAPIVGQNSSTNGCHRWLPCVSAWNKDPVFGVIGIQSGV
jgi:hypothetical protein